MTNLARVRDKAAQGALAALEKAASAAPDEVFIVCVMANGDIAFHDSGTFSRMRLLGALELLKDNILRGEG